jgi:AhpD family alkylhydroperoxidase
MEARLNYFGSDTATRFVKYLNSAGRVVHDSTLPAATRELVNLRASQINGCACCTDMHAKDALAAGETHPPQTGVGGGRVATFCRAAAPAALELTEEGTRIADAAGGVSDEVWANARKHYDDDQLAALVCQIAGINAWNRLNVITRQPAGDYQPGQFG